MASWRACGVCLCCAGFSLLFACSADRQREAQGVVQQETISAPADSPAGAQERAQEAYEQAGKALGPQGPALLYGHPTSPQQLPPSSALSTRLMPLLVTVNTPYQIFEGRGTYVHVAAWQMNGQPAQRADVYVGEQRVGMTDDDGTLVFKYPIAGAKHEVNQRSMVTVVDPKTPDRRGQVAFAPSVRTSSFETDRVFVYTERGVYAPGEQLRFRALAMKIRGDYEPLVEQELQFSLRGLGYSGAVSLTTDEFGVASGALTLPDGLSEGVYLLSVLYKNARQSTRIQVRAFKPPMLKLEHTLPRYLTPVDDTLSFAVTLNPISDEKIGQGQLSALISRSGSGYSMVTMRQRVAGAGRYEFTLSKGQLAQLKSHTGSDTLEFDLRFLGEDGLEERVLREVIYTSTPHTAVLEADREVYVMGDAAQVTARVRTFDGLPAPALALELELGSNRKRRYSAKTNAQGVAVFDVPMNQGKETARLYVSDRPKDMIAQVELTAQPQRQMVSQVGAGDPLKERAVVDVVVRFPSLIAPVERVVHMDVVDTSGAIVYSALLPVEETPEGPVARGKLRAPSWGSMLVTFFALAKNVRSPLNPAQGARTLGILTEGQSMVVQPDRALEIVLDGVPDKVEPGQSFEANIKVKQRDGEPAPSMLGVSMVDARQLALKDPLEVLPGQYFYDPTLRAMSTTGARMLSWPVVSRNWGLDYHDIGLPPFGFMFGGDALKLDEQHVELASQPDPEDAAAKHGKAKSKAKMTIITDGEPREDFGRSASVDDGGMMSRGFDTGTRPEAKARPKSRRASPFIPPNKVPKITIRTEFGPSALWLPHVRTSGHATIAVKAPDAISPQAFIVVAHDKRGGFAVAKTSVEVTQPLFVEAKLPAVMRAKERVKFPLHVQSVEAGVRTAQVSFVAEGLRVLTKPQQVTLDDEGRQVVWIEVEPPSPGEFPFEARISAGEREDVARDKVRVLPSGAPVEERWEGVASGDKVYTAQLPPLKDRAYTKAEVEISLPTFFGAGQLMTELKQALANDPLSLSADLVSAALVLQLAKRHKLDSPELAALKTRVQEAVAGLSASHSAGDSGAYAYWRNGRTSPMVTAWALEGFAEALVLDVAVPEALIKRSTQWLASQFNQDGEIAADELSFWQGDGATVRAGVSAQSFEILTRLPEALKHPDAIALQQKLAGKYRARLISKTAPSDALTTAYMLLGVRRLGLLKDDQAEDVIDALLPLRRQGHWEPSWFHAYGGSVELNAALLEAMAAVNPQRYRVQMVEALQYLLSTRQSLGAAHNERGTAATLRALLMVARPDERLPQEISVWLGERELKRVKLKPESIWASMISLGTISIPDELARQGGQLKVLVEGGNSAPMISVKRRHWVEGVRRQAEREGLKAGITGAPAREVRRGRRASLELSLVGAGLAQIRIADSSLVEPDLGALDAMMVEVDGLIRYRRVDDAMILDVFLRGDQMDLTLPFIAKREGSANWPTILVNELALSAGALRVR